MPRDSAANGASAAKPAVPARSRRDWTARARGTAMDAIRYSQFVGLMKRALPIGAAAVLAAVIVYALLPRQSDKITITAQSMKLKNDLSMMKPRLTGTDDDGNPFVITADIAIQDPHHLHRGHMKGVEADSTSQDGHWTNVVATEGDFDMDAGTLKLRKGVSLYTDTGNELHSADVDINMKKGLFHGPGVVTGHGPFGTMRADRFDADHVKQLLHLVGHVQTNFSTVGNRHK